MSEPDVTKAPLATASQTAAAKRTAPATIAIPLPMKSLVTVVLDMRSLSISM